MSYTPVVSGSGLAGWSFLKATRASQQRAFDAGPQIRRDSEYFAKTIAGVKSAEELVADRRLRSVALVAYGLQDDIDNRFFIRKILEEGTTSNDALANRLADDRYKRFSKAFGFGEIGPPRTILSNFPDEVLARYKAQSFELAVGKKDDNLRLALNFERLLPEQATGDGSNDAKWFRIMGTPPLRAVIEGALGLPAAFGQIDLDQQLSVMKTKSKQRFGSDNLADLAQPKALNRMVQSFLVRRQIDDIAAGTAPGQIALSLLQSAR